MENIASEEDFIKVEVGTKREISEMLNAFGAKNIEVYQAIIKNDLEDLFLSLTEN